MYEFSMTNPPTLVLVLAPILLVLTFVPMVMSFVERFTANMSAMRKLSWSIILFCYSIPVLFFFFYWAVSVPNGELCIANAETSKDVMYFTYVTYTTLGYGDMQPVGACRYIAVIEAVAGYIMLGFLTSRFLAASNQT